MNDQEIKLVIKSLWDNAGTNKSLGDLRLLVEATEKGSQEAGAALDEWRAKYGKLKDTLTYSGPNAGLATAPSMGGAPRSTAVPPVIPSAPAPPGDEGEGLGSALRGQIGSMAGQAVGLPGLGTAGRYGTVAGGIAAAGIALAKAVQLTKEWLAGIREITREASNYELLGTTIENIAAKTRKLEIHNQDLAATYARITENVHTVSAEIAHLNEYQQTQLTMQARVAAAQMDAELARNALANRFNPIERIREETRIRDEALQRQMNQELELERHKERMHQEDARRSKERQEMYQSQAAASRERIKLLEQEAEKAEKQAKDVEKTRDAATAEMKAELEMIREMAAGKAGMTDIPGYLQFRARQNQALNPSSDASDKVVQMGLDAARGSGLGAFRFGDRVQGPAAARQAELEEAIAANERAKQDADSLARQEQGKLERERRQAAFAEDKAMGLEEESQSAAYKAEQQRKVLEEKQAQAARELEAQREANQKRGELEILNQFHPASLSPTGGGASVDPQMQRNNELLERVVMALEGQA